MSEHVRQYVRYLNVAKTLQAIAEDYGNDPAVRRTLIGLAELFDQSATALIKPVVQSKHHSRSVEHHVRSGAEPRPVE